MSATEDATTYGNVVAGERTGAVGGELAAVIAPATEEVIAHVPRGGAEDVERAVAAAVAAAPVWGRTTPAERALALLRLPRPPEEDRAEPAHLGAREAR